MADVLRIAQADSRGLCRRGGRWSVAECLHHLAAWIEYGFEGYPLAAPPELAEKARARKDLALNEGLRAEFWIPGVEGGTTGQRKGPTEEAFTRYRDAWERLARETPSHEHPFFGSLTRGEWLKLHLRHAELHLSFLHA